MSLTQHITSELLKSAIDYSKTIINDLNQSVTSYHFVEMANKKLTDSGFIKIFEKEKWILTPGKKYFYSRNNTTLIAFSIGEMFCPAKSCFKILCGHTDSPGLHLAPNSYSPSSHLERYCIQTYGGNLNQTWFDRMLSIAGKIIINNTNGGLESKLIKIERPLMFIPSLPPHLCNLNNKIQWNNETHLKPILMTSFLKEKAKTSEDTTKSEASKRLGNELIKIICDAVEPKISPEELIDFDLFLYDSQKASLMGLNDEFISSARLDNLTSSIPAVHSLIEMSTEEKLKEQSSINIIGLFDNEEIGNLSYQGAKSNFFGNHLKRIVQVLSNDINEESYLSFCSRSFCISADVNHAFNPNYAEKYQSNHLLYTQEGVAIGVNVKGALATDSEGASIIQRIAKKVDVPIEFGMDRQEKTSGRTMGPQLASTLGIKTVDIGISQLAMHSIRETCGICDIYHEKMLFDEYFKSFEEYRGKLIN